MKKSILIVMLIVWSSTLLADEGRIREAGVNFSNLNHFGLTYRSGTGGSLWRFSTFGVNGRVQNSEVGQLQGSQNSLLLGAGIGREYRKPIAGNLFFRYGLDATFSFRREEENDFEENRKVARTIRPGINGVIGAAYELNEHLVLGAELQPSLFYSRNVLTSGNHDLKNVTHELSYHFTSAGLLFSLAYRF